MGLIAVSSSIGSAADDGWFLNRRMRSQWKTKLDVAAIVAMLVGLLWTWVVFSALRPKILYFSQLTSGLLLSVHAIILLVNGFHFFGVMVLFLVVGDTLWMLHVRPRLKFVQVLLDVVVQALRSRPQLLYIVLGPP